MIKTDEIILKIERYASPELAESWDNTGWQINLHHDYTNRVLIALSFTKEVLEQAITNDCDLIITHHPPIFHKLSKIDNNLIIQAIKHNICVYSAHTNLDKTYGSTTDALCGVLGLKNLITVNDYIKISHLKDEIALDEFVLGIKQSLNSVLKYQGKEELDTLSFMKLLKNEAESLDIKPEFLKRFVNVGFSGGEKKRFETLQMSLLKPDFCILDEIDSGLDIDALKTVAEGVNNLRTQKNAFLVITHYQRLLTYIVPDVVHIFADGHIIKTGSASLAEQLEKNGYADFITGE